MKTNTEEITVQYAEVATAAGTGDKADWVTVTVYFAFPGYRQPINPKAPRGVSATLYHRY